MGEVITFGRYDGRATCGDCGHSWLAVVPVVNGHRPPRLECPECRKMTGRYDPHGTLAAAMAILADDDEPPEAA